jgi:hypothetical protein
LLIKCSNLFVTLLVTQGASVWPTTAYIGRENLLEWKLKKVLSLETKVCNWPQKTKRAIDAGAKNGIKGFERVVWFIFT